MEHVERDPKTGRLIYRRVYPLALRPFIPPPNVQLKRSLSARTLEASGTMEKFRDAAAQYAATVALALKASTGSFDTLTPELIAFLVTAYKAEELGMDEEVRWLDRPLAVKTRAALRSRQFIEEDLADCRDLRALGDIAGIIATWGDAASDYAETHLFRLDRSAASFPQYCRAFNDINIETWEAMEERLDGREVPTPAAPIASQQIAAEAPPSSASGDPFEEIAMAILDSARQVISPTTRQGAQTALRFLREALGPTTPAALTRKAVTGWLDLMAQRPAKVPRAQRSTTLQELAALYADRPDVPRLSPVTLDRHVGAVGTLWRKAVTAGTIDEDLPNPFKGRASPAGPRRRRGPKGFSISEMQAVFALPIFTEGERPRRGRGEASYWLPLMLLWTGARPEEIAQMVVADINKDAESGRWIMTITDEGDHPVKGPQSLKTSKKGTGVRAFPVPAPLIDLGILEYLTWLTASGKVALFPQLTTKNARKLLFPSFGEWWSIYVRKHEAIPAGGGRQPSREFRHSFATAARASGIPRDAREYLMGHRAAGATANEGYGEMVALGLTIDQLSYAGLDLSGVRRWTVP